jgi:hypothetical protein
LLAVHSRNNETGDPVEDPLHESKQALGTVKREYTAVGSLNTQAAFVAFGAVEGSLLAAFRVACDAELEYQKLGTHKPGKWIAALGVGSYYSQESQAYATRIDSFALDRARYESTPAFQSYVRATGRSAELVQGTERFIAETEKLLGSESFLRALRQNSKP